MVVIPEKKEEPVSSHGNPSREDILWAAISVLAKLEGSLPTTYRPTKYCLEIDGVHFASKLVLAVANRLAMGDTRTPHNYFPSQRSDSCGASSSWPGPAKARIVCSASDSADVGRVAITSNLAP